jgi:uncharacterized protein (TIGR03435 family)
MMRSLFGTFIAALTITAMAIGAQSAPDDKRPSFVVASVKPNRSGNPRATTVPLQPNGRYAIINASLDLLIAFAFQPRQSYEIVGVPEWALTERFDIDARAEGTPPAREIFLMLQSLLAERFKLVTHNETRQMPVYSLVAAQSGRLGPRLRRHIDDSGCIDRSQAVSRGTIDPAGPLPTPICGGWSGAPNLGRLAGQRIELDVFGRTLSGQLGRPVIDRTGLTGPFDLTMEWTPQGPASAEAQAILDASPNPDRPSIFTAVQEQLGLRLISEAAPVEVLVIDHVERPSEN